MAIDQEKAKAVLQRFRDAQAAEFGMSGERKDRRRPRIVASVTTLTGAEVWRNDVIDELDRKITRIQNYGLPDYEIRDLNDEINQLFHEKDVWERHIVALGGADYRTGTVRLVDDAGHEIPGVRDYKYFGRAKDLPGVKELFERTQEQDEQLESFRTQKYKRFQDQSGAYFGDEDEDDGVLLDQEYDAEARGWAAGWARIADALGADGADGAEVPEMPRVRPQKLGDAAQAVAGKRAKQAAQNTPALAAPLLSALDPQELDMPHVATREEIEQFILGAKKAALRREYLS